MDGGFGNVYRTVGVDKYY